MTLTIDTSIFDKKPRFLGIFIITSLIGVLLISLAVIHASREQEVIHDINEMYRILQITYGDDKIQQALHAKTDAIQASQLFAKYPDYRFYYLSGKEIQPLQTIDEEGRAQLQTIDLPATRLNPHGGSFEAANQNYTWVTFDAKDTDKRLLVVHKFHRSGNNVLIDEYKKYMIIPAIFYLWLMVWVALIFNHLLKKLKTQQDQMKHMALHDPLTGLPNRTLMQNRLAKLIQANQRENKPFAFCLIDIDNFKLINDQFGHTYGDELLRQIAKRLQQCLRDVDSAARYGGDEFTALLPQLDEQTWQPVFIRIYNALTKQYALFDTILTINVSIGVSLYPSHGRDPESLIREADQAMYAVKASGGGMRLYSEEEVFCGKAASTNR